MTMKILITAGGTTEPIDAVRGITNFSSGKLGVRLATALMDEHYEVTLIAGNKTDISSMPEVYRSSIHKIRSAADLLEKLYSLKKSGYVPDVVIHSMAVSDYTISAVSDIEELAGAIYNRNHSILNELREVSSTGVNLGIKQPSSIENPVLFLKQTPKIIDLIKSEDLWPSTRLIGFKLLSNASALDLVEASIAQMKRTNCDAVVANDLQNIAGEDHEAMIIPSSFVGVTTVSTKAEIIRGILHLVNTWEKEDE